MSPSLNEGIIYIPGIIYFKFICLVHFWANKLILIALPDTDILQWDTINMLREKCQGASGPEAFVHELQHK